MDDADDLPQRKKKLYEAPILDGWSVEDLGDYLVHLQAEALRVEARLKAKRQLADDAAALFKGGN